MTPSILSSKEAHVNVLTTILELLGLGLIVAGVALVFIPAALIVAGAGCVWISRQVSR